jgi:hypothetical protein
MTRAEYLNWIQGITAQLAEERYPNNKQLQIVYAMGLCQRALADLCYIDSDNTSRVNRMYKQNTSKPTRPYRTKQQ